MFKYEQQYTISMFEYKLEDFIILRDRIEGDNYHMSPNDEGFTGPHEEYMWAKMNITWLEERIAGLKALTPYQYKEEFLLAEFNSMEAHKATHAAFLAAQDE